MKKRDENSTELSPCLTCSLSVRNLCTYARWKFICSWTRKMETITKKKVDGNVAFIPVFFPFFMNCVLTKTEHCRNKDYAAVDKEKKIVINDPFYWSMCWLVIFGVRAGLHVQHTNSGLLQSLPHQRCHRWCEDLGPANAKVLLSSFLLELLNSTI